MKIIVYSCVQGRLKTVNKCLNLSPKVERLIVYSEDSDGDYLKTRNIDHLYKHPNEPLSEKWSYGLKKLKDIDFDYVVMMGSDDYFNNNLLKYIENNPGYDMLGFTDMYFLNQANEVYYWEGYKNQRRGEPAGAGKTYSKEFLERIDYNLFPVTRPRGLDGQSWVVVNHSKAKMKIASLKEEGIMLCDVKDGQGITPIANIKGLVRV